MDANPNLNNASPGAIDTTNDRLCPIRFVLNRYAVTDKTIRKRIRLKLFPEPDQVIGRCRMWWFSTLLAYERGLPKARGAK